MSRYLLDTNILVFLIVGDNISNDVTAIIEDYTNKLYASSLSVMELSHLIKNNKVKTAFKSIEDLVNFLQDNYYIDVLHTKNEHLQTLYNLRQVDKHSDPIDHFIISQAVSERITLISSDTKFKDYTKQKLKFVFNKR